MHVYRCYPFCTHKAAAISTQFINQNFRNRNHQSGYSGTQLLPVACPSHKDFRMRQFQFSFQDRRTVTPFILLNLATSSRLHVHPIRQIVTAQTTVASKFPPWITKAAAWKGDSANML